MLGNTPEYIFLIVNALFPHSDAMMWLLTHINYYISIAQCNSRHPRDFYVYSLHGQEW